MAEIKLLNGKLTLSAEEALEAYDELAVLFGERRMPPIEWRIGSPVKTVEPKFYPAIPLKPAELEWTPPHGPMCKVK